VTVRTPISPMSASRRTVPSEVAISRATRLTVSQASSEVAVACSMQYRLPNGCAAVCFRYTKWPAGAPLAHHLSEGNVARQRLPTHILEKVIREPNEHGVTNSRTPGTPTIAASTTLEARPALVEHGIRRSACHSHDFSSRRDVRAGRPLMRDGRRRPDNSRIAPLGRFERLCLAWLWFFSARKVRRLSRSLL
jgi:hypothetical protein